MNIIRDGPGRDTSDMVAKGRTFSEVSILRSGVAPSSFMILATHLTFRWRHG